MDIEAIRKQVEQQVMQYFHLEPTVTDAPYAGMVTGVDVISHLEHSLLNPDTTLETIERECAVARKYSVAAVCVAPYYVPAAREILLGSPVAVGTAIGFPHGCMSQAAKLAELRECMANGATEVDVALNVLAIKSGRLDVAQRELDELVRCAVGKVQLKAVFEHALYTPEEKRAVLQMLRSSGVNYVKIQNMLSGHGARVEDVRDPRPQCRHQDRRRHQDARAGRRTACRRRNAPWPDGHGEDRRGSAEKRINDTKGNDFQWISMKLSDR